MNVTGLRNSDLQNVKRDIEYGNPPLDPEADPFVSELNFKIKFNGRSDYTDLLITIDASADERQLDGSPISASPYFISYTNAQASGFSKEEFNNILEQGYPFTLARRASIKVRRYSSPRIKVTQLQSGDTILENYFPVYEGRVINIQLPADIHDDDYQVELIPVSQVEQGFYRDFKLITKTLVKVGENLQTRTQESNLLPHFKETIRLSSITGISKVSFAVKTPAGEMIDRGRGYRRECTKTGQIWSPLLYFLFIFRLLLKLNLRFYLNEQLESGLDLWTDHTLLIEYDILDDQTLAFVARVEEEVKIHTDLEDERQRGMAAVRLSYFGVVESLSFQVRSPRGEIIARGEKSPKEIQASGGQIEIDVPPRRLADLSGLRLIPERPQKTVGRVLDFFGRAQYENVQVIIFVTKDPEKSEASFFPIETIVTETEGYFQFKTPTDFYEAAYVKVGILGQAPSVSEYPINLESIKVIDRFQEGVAEDGTPILTEKFSEKLAFPARIIIVLDGGASSQHNDDCDCGNCSDLGFHKPRRVLEEFSYYKVVRTTEPEIRRYSLEEDGKVLIREFADLIKDYDRAPGMENVPSDFEDTAVDKDLVLKYTNPRLGLSMEKVRQIIIETNARRLRNRLQPTSENRAPGRAILSARHPIDWDEEPTIYQATTVAHGRILTYKQEWVNDGYSLGDLIYSLPLAPGQKKQIVTFDWERREAAAGSEILEYEESFK